MLHYELLTFMSFVEKRNIFSIDFNIVIKGDRFMSLQIMINVNRSAEASEIFKWVIYPKFQSS